MTARLFFPSLPLGERGQGSEGFEGQTGATTDLGSEALTSPALLSQRERREKGKKDLGD
jgi:hypothetical protein